MKKFILAAFAILAIANCADAQYHRTQVQVLLNSVGLVPVEQEVLIQRNFNSFQLGLGVTPVPVSHCGSALVGFHRNFGLVPVGTGAGVNVNINNFNRRFRR